MRLSEIFKSSYEWEVFRSRPRLTVITFSSDKNKKYEVTFEFNQDASKRYNTNVWELEFALVSKDLYNPLYTSAITNTGDQYRVFSTIIDIIVDFKRNNPGAVIAFSAIEPSREKLYKRMVHTLTTKHDAQIFDIRHYRSGAEFLIV